MRVFNAVAVECKNTIFCCLENMSATFSLKNCTILKNANLCAVLFKVRKIINKRKLLKQILCRIFMIFELGVYKKYLYI